MTGLIDRLHAFVALDGGDIADVEAAVEEINRLQAENGRLSALAGPSGKTLAELESINDGLIAENERLQTERDALKAALRDLLSVSTLSPDERIKVRTAASKLLETPNGK